MYVFEACYISRCYVTQGNMVRMTVEFHYQMSLHIT